MSWSCVGAGTGFVLFIGFVLMLGLSIVINLFDRRD